MRKIVFVIAMALICASASAAGLDRKLFKRAAEKVWSSGNSYFDVNRAVPDSIADSVSAVILTRYAGIEASLEAFSNAMTSTRRVKRTHFTREMVKLLDNSAIEKFSEFTFGGRSKVEIPGWGSFGESRNAFGARVHKPDGTIVDIDVNQSYPISEGKEAKTGKGGKNSQYKMPIPGLEVGDVIEYFNYTESWTDFVPLSPLTVDIVGDYPIMTLAVEGTFAPQLTIDYRPYNGAPHFQHGVDDKGRNTIKFVTEDVPVVYDSHFIAPRRQLPFISMYTLDNGNRRYGYVMMSARGEGLRPSVPVGSVYREVAERQAKTQYEGIDLLNAGKLLKEWIKTHPDATISEQTDAAWLASLYTALMSKDSHNDRTIVALFSDLLFKQKLAGDSTGMGFLNSRLDVPTNGILHWIQPDFVGVTDNRIFIPNAFLNYYPGEVPGVYQGEEGGVFDGRRDKLTTASMPRVFKAAPSRQAQNTLSMEVNASLGEDGELVGKHRISLTGTAKRIAELNDMASWAAEVEDFFAIPEKKRYKPSTPEDKRAEELLDDVKDLSKSFFVETPEKIGDIEVTSRGFLREAPSMDFSFACTHPAAVSEAVDARVVQVGRLLVGSERLEGRERQRVLPIVRDSPGQLRTVVRFNVPEGYAIDEASLPALENNIANMTGNFYTHAAVDEQGNLELTVVERYRNYSYDVALWEPFLELLDASADFCGASVVLKRK